jgi:alpha-tubulin suppressor-like RCC1 family protein
MEIPARFFALLNAIVFCASVSAQTSPTSGSLWDMGDNSQYQLGDGTRIQRNSPVQIVASGVQTVAAGAQHSLILKTDGSLWGTASNGYGELGIGTTWYTYSPVQVLPGMVQAIAAGAYYSLVLKTDGSLWAMGNNGNGQLGDGTTTQRNVPVQIFAGGVQAMAAGYGHSLIVKTDGSLWVMGRNDHGQLGDGTTTQRNVPVQIFAGGVQAVAAGYWHSLIVMTDGSLWAMGDNSNGALGDGTTTQRASPVQILSGGVRAVAAGGGTSLIVKTDGSLWVMGSNSYGQLGDGTTTQRTSPVQILSGGVQAVAAGTSHSLILKTNGSMWGMGENDSGQLGDGTTTRRRYTPELIAGNVQTIAAGWDYSLFVASGDIVCAPQFTAQPVDQTVSSGGTVTIGATATGIPAPNYQWQVSTDSGTTWTSLSNTMPYTGATTGTLTITSVTMAMNGYQYRCVASNGVNPDATSNAAMLTVDKAAASVMFWGLSATYNGTAHGASATTLPMGLAVTITYDGSTTAPTNAGSYTVVGTINDTNYQGSASGTLVIAKASATVALGSLNSTYDGTPHSATAITAPTGLTVGFTYNGSATAPTNAGSYTVVGTISDANYSGTTTATGTLVIAKAAAMVTLGGLSAIYDGAAHNATATTSPTGLNVSLTYTGSATAPTNAGSYAVVGTISDANYQGSASGTLVIGKAAVTVTLSGLTATYDGATHSAAATTSPAGLNVTFSYDGSATVPSNAGSYAVIGTISDANYQGSNSGTLVIAKAPLTAKANDKSKAHGTPNPTLTITYTGFVNGETAAVLDTPPTASTTATASSLVGAYPITLTGGSDNNYAITLENGTLTVTVGPTLVTPASKGVGAEALSYQILVSSCGNWTATVDANWVTLSPTSGSGDGNILVTVTANTTGGARTATIRVDGATHTLRQRVAGALTPWLGGKPDTIDLLAVNPSSGRMMILQSGCFYASNDSGTTWVSSGAGFGGNWLRKIYSSIKGGEFATASSGLLRFPAGGSAWISAVAVTESGYGSLWTENSDGTIQAYIVSESVGTCSLYRSLDGGATWSLLTSNAPIWKPVGLGVLDANTFLISDSAGLIQRTADAGATFTVAGTAQGLSGCTPTDLLVDHANHNNVFVGSWWRGVYRSSDGGQSWSPYNTGLPSGRGVSMLAQGSDGTTLAIVADQKGSEGIFRLNTSLGSWEDLSATIPCAQRKSTCGIGVGPGGRMYGAFGLWGVVYQDPCNSDWTRVITGGTFGIPPSAGSLSIDSGGRIFAVAYNTFPGPWTGSGIFCSSDGGQTWSSRGDDPEYLDVHSVASDGDGNTYASYYATKVTRSADGGDPLYFSFPWAATKLVAAGGKVYAGTYFAGIYLSEDKAQTWRPLSGLPAGHGVTDFTVLSDGRIVCLVADQLGNYGLYKSNTTGDAWETNMDGIPADSAGGIEGVGSGGAGALYAYGPGVFVRQASADSPWVSLDIPGGSGVLCVAPFVSGGTLVGTEDGGVYERNEESGDWIKVGDSRLDTTSVEVLATKPDGTIYAGTDDGVYWVVWQQPWVATQPSSQTSTVGSTLEFTVVAGGPFLPTYQWQASIDGGNVWANLTDAAPYSGTTTGTLTITRASPALNGCKYRCVASNGVPPNATSNVVTLTVNQAPAADFNGDGQSDLLWQNLRTGACKISLVNGTTVASEASLGTLPVAWRIVGTADFNGDGKMDILWQNTVTGEWKIWLMNGTAMTSEVLLGTVPTGWQIVGVADFNGDGQPDILWQNTSTGERGFYLMNGTTVTSWVSLGVMATDWQIAGVGDFNGDSQTDILWQNTSTGERGIYMMSGTSVTGWASLGIVPAAWQIAGAGDYNGDGHTDILWQNTVTGERGAWLMNGTSVTGWISLATVSTDWSLAGNNAVLKTAANPDDFNGDGNSDILWQNTTTGERGFYLMNGTAVSGWLSLGTVPTAWQIAGTGDFNGDGKPDILWQNTSTGERGLYLMNGTAVTGWVSLPSVPTAWQIAGTGDFNGDGNTDILWQNTVTGEYGVYLMNGTTVTSWVSLGTVPTAWQIAGTGDFNGGGQTDILWQNTSTGERGIYLMSGTTMTGWVSLPGVPTAWQIAGTGDFNGDGQTDILWQNTSTGERGIYLMNGTTVTGWVSLGTVPTAWSMKN